MNHIKWCLVWKLFDLELMDLSLPEFGKMSHTVQIKEKHAIFMSGSFNYFINTSFFISVYKITVCTSTQEWFTKSMSSVPMLRKIEHILNCLHVRHRGDNAPFHKVLYTLLPIHRHTGVSWSAQDIHGQSPKCQPQNLPWQESTWSSLCAPFSSSVHFWGGK